MQTDILTIEHLQFGEEQFEIECAAYNLYEGGDGIWEFVVKVTTGDAIMRTDELKDLVDAKPWFEATSIMEADDLALSAGDVIVQEQGYDYERDQNLSNFYYFRHESVEDLSFVIHEVSDTEIDATLTGQTIINGSSGNTCDSRITLRTRFLKDDSLRRGIQ